MTGLISLGLFVAVDNYGLSMKRVWGRTVANFASARRVTMIRSPRRPTPPPAPTPTFAPDGTELPPETRAARVTWAPTAGAVRYRIHYGTRPGVYEGVIESANPAAVVDGLAPAQRYYFAVSSVDASGRESEPRDEFARETPP